MTGREEWFVWHITQIPNLLEHIRSQVVPLQSARYEARVTGSKDVARLPYNVQAADDADLLWALLVQLGQDIHSRIGGSRPAELDQVWVVDGDVQGTLAADGYTQAWRRAQAVVRWMVACSHQIAGLDLHDAVEFVVEQTRKLRGRYPDAPAELSYRPRPCPVCGLRSVHVFWLSGRVEDAQVECTKCGYELEVGTMDVVDVLLVGEQPARLA